MTNTVDGWFRDGGPGSGPRPGGGKATPTPTPEKPRPLSLREQGELVIRNQRKAMVERGILGYGGTPSKNKDAAAKPYLLEATPKAPFGKLRKPSDDCGRSRDSGTSEGAKKAAQTRRQGGHEHSVRSHSGQYGVDIKAGSNQAVPRITEREPYRGYDMNTVDSWFRR